MKLNEFKVKKQVNELDMSDLIGDLGAAKLKSGFGKLTGGASGQMKSTDIAARDRFIKDFVGNTASELANAISSGIVTVGAAGGTPPSGPPGAGGGAPPTPPTGGAQGAAPPPKPGQPAPPPKPGQPAPPTQPSATTAPPTQPTQSTTTPKLDPRAAGAKARQKLQTRAFNRAVKENTYDKLNAIFESIMRLDEAMSVTDFIKNKVTNYMKGTPNLDKYTPDIERLAAEVGKAYGQGGKAGNAAIMAPLQKIGGMMHTIINTEMGDAQGAGAAQGATADATAGAEQGATAAATTANTGKMKALKQAISKMKKRDRDSLLSYLTQITPAQATAPATTTSATEPSSAMGAMANQLAAIPTASSTGGKTTGVSGVEKGVVRHTSSPTNPNQSDKIKAMKDIAAKTPRTKTVKAKAPV